MAKPNNRPNPSKRVKTKELEKKKKNKKIGKRINEKKKRAGIKEGR